MYTFPSKLKLFSIVLIVLGLIGIIFGFLSAPKTVEDVQNILAAQESHAAEVSDHEDESTANFVDRARGRTGYAEMAMEHATDLKPEGVGTSSHEEHVLHQMKARPWSAVFVSAFFFLMLALGTLVFYAIQFAARAGWSPGLYRVMEGITAYVLPGSIIVFFLVVFAGTNFFPWQNEELVATDKILQGKAGYLNFPFFVIRALIYVIGWNLYRYIARRNSLDQATAKNHAPYRKNYKAAVIFLVFFMVTEAFMAIDWFMTLTPHWYSQMFPWYVLSTILIAAVTTIALVTIYLKSKGLITFISDKHLHDLAKYMFAFSIFWTYIWFSQFMLIWYANVPEEVTYFIIRIQEYNFLFFGRLILNFVFPILLLMNSDFKRVPWLVVITGVVLLVGSYMNVYLLVMPSTVGLNWGFGITEIAAILFFLGLFIFVVGNGLSKVSLRPENDPYIRESDNYHF